MISAFDKISAKQLVIFCNCIIDISSQEIDFLKQLYTRTATNVQDTINVFENLGLLTISGKHILLSRDLEELLDKLKQREDIDRDKIIRQFLIKILLTNQNSLSKDVIGFLHHFELVGGQYCYTPTTAERLHYSAIRNLLLGLEFMHLDSATDTYLVSEDYSHLYSEVRQNRPISIDELYRAICKQEELGYAAEIRILNYEKERLSSDPQLSTKIKHIGQKDISAGYDIKSYECIPDRNDQPVPRFIEVKAVARQSVRFFWTRNEIEAAKRLGESYHLYLLPVLKKSDFDINGLKIIKDPYANVYDNRSTWRIQEELVSCSYAGETILST